MIAVIFEAQPHPGRKDAYLDAAASLRPLLADIDGFVSIERFESLTQPGKILSLSYWRDEDAVRQWDDQGKVAGLKTPSLGDYRALIESLAI